MGVGLRSGAVVLLVALLGLSGCRPDGSGSGPLEVRGALAIGPSEVAFERVPLGGFRDARLTLRNVSRRRVTVSRLSSTMASVTVAPGGGAVLAPAQVLEVGLRFAPAVEGEVAGALVVETDLDGQARVERVPLRGEGVRGFVNIRPEVLDFGRVELDTGKDLTVEVRNPTAVDAFFTLSLGGSDAAVFSSPDAGPEVRLGPGEVRQVPITFRPLQLGLAQATATLLRCATCLPEVVQLRGEGGAGMLEIVPPRLDYGRVAPSAHVEQRVTLRNTGNVPTTFLRAWAEEGDDGYSVVSQPPQTTLRQGQSVDITVAFQPSASGLHSGLLRLEVQEGSAPVRSYAVALTGAGGGSCVTFLPRTLDFGAVPPGMRLTREVQAYNSCPQDVTLTELSVRTTQGGFFHLESAAAPVVVPKGSRVPVRVTFGPEAAGAGSEGQLTAVVQQGATTGADVVALKGTSRDFAPCQYRLEPAQLSFGRVQVGSTVTLGVALTNVGTRECFVARMGLATGSDGAFSTDAFEGGVLAPGAKALLAVRFTPAVMGLVSGHVEGEVNHPTRGTLSVPLSAEGVQSCLSLQPSTVDFGDAKPGCGERRQKVTALNRCNATVVITAAGLDLATSGDLREVDAPDLPRVLDPGEDVDFFFAYAPTDAGQDTAAFRVTTPQLGTLTVGLRGGGLDGALLSERFSQVRLDQVDVLFVVDNSLSMAEEQHGLSQNFAAFMGAALGGGVDYHIGITTTGINPSSENPPIVCNGSVHGGEAGRLFPADNSSPRIITPATPNAAAVFATNTNVGICPEVERGLDAAYLALSAPLVSSADDPRTPLPNDGNAGFLRPGARLAIVFVSDEEDNSLQPVPFYEAFFKKLKGNDPNMLSISAVVGPEALATCPTAPSSGHRYLALARATGGAEESICTADWASALKKLSDAAFGLKSRFPLSHPPADPARISVTVDGFPVTSGWTYDALRNLVEFAPGSVPPAGALVEVSYPPGC